LNVRGAYLHVLSDTISSIGVVIAGILIIVTGNYIFDPLISALIGVVILISCLRLIKESAQILMEAVPTHIDLQKVSDDIQKIHSVKEVHDLHIWSIASDVFALSSETVFKARPIISTPPTGCKTLGRVDSSLLWRSRTDSPVDILSGPTTD
jgi:cobalt-zinc-cadmium efflux system protein